MADLFSDKKNILLSSLVLSILLAGVALIFRRNTWAAGVVLGAVTGIVNFYFLSAGFAQAFEPSREEGNKSLPPPKVSPGLNQWALTGKFLTRYLFLALAFFLVFKMPWIHFLSFISGFFIVHLYLGLSGLFQILRSPNR